KFFLAPAAVLFRRLPVSVVLLFVDEVPIAVFSLDLSDVVIILQNLRCFFYIFAPCTYKYIENYMKKILITLFSAIMMMTTIQAEENPFFLPFKGPHGTAPFQEIKIS